MNFRDRYNLQKYGVSPARTDNFFGGSYTFAPNSVRVSPNANPNPRKLLQ